MQIIVNGVAYGVRNMQLSDLASVLQIEQQVHSHPWSLAQFTSSIESSHHCRVLERSSNILGYVITSTAADEAELLNIAIAPGEQRKGLGEALLEYACQSFNNTIASFFLEVRVSNVGAIALYHKLGFNEVGHRPNYYPLDSHSREDALIMAKVL